MRAKEWDMRVGAKSSQEEFDSFEKGFEDSAQIAAELEALALRVLNAHERHL